jgi:hypothetical protein
MMEVEGKPDLHVNQLIKVDSQGQLVACAPGEDPIGVVTRLEYRDIQLNSPTTTVIEAAIYGWLAAPITSLAEAGLAPGVPCAPEETPPEEPNIIEEPEESSYYDDEDARWEEI